MHKNVMAVLPDIAPDQPVLIAGPTASGKSALALAIAEDSGGVIVNADASQVFDCWRVITARPSAEEEARAPHRLYGHLTYDAPYSVGHWLRELAPLLQNGPRPIIIGGTGLYFRALTQGLAEIPPVPDAIRAMADRMRMPDMLAALDPATTALIATDNRARVQRAFEVQQATGRGLASWQSDPQPALLPLNQTVPLVLDAPKLWLTDRINRRFDAMLAAGAMDEVAAMRHLYDPALPSCRAIGVPELMACLTGQMSIDAAREKATVATRQFAKRQRTWFRSKMVDWHWVPGELVN